MASNSRYFVYDVRTDCENFTASFSDRAQADEWAAEKFGTFAFVTDVPLHDKVKGHVPRTTKGRGRR